MTRKIVTLFVPDGYVDADEFLRDCQFERAQDPDRASPDENKADPLRDALKPFLEVAKVMDFYTEDSMPEMTFPRRGCESIYPDEPRCVTLTSQDFARLAALAAPQPAIDYHLPDWDDVRGIAPNATGDLSSEAFVREMRDQWPDRQPDVAAPQPAAPLGGREAIDIALRAYFQSLSDTSPIQMSSDGVERVYYAGFSLDGLTEAILAAIPQAIESECCREDTASLEPCSPFAELQDENERLRTALAAIPQERGAVADIVAERDRQISQEGWSREHDDAHIEREMAIAAACYASAPSMTRIEREWVKPDMPKEWPWKHSWWKPGTMRKNLVKAGALIVAEIERLDRAALQKDKP